MDRIEVGVVSRPHGVRGELRVHLHNPESTAFDVVDDVFVGGEHFELESARLVKGAVLLRIEGIEDRTQAEALIGKGIEVRRDQLELEEDDVLLDDLLGCRVELSSGEPWGEIVEVISGVQDRLVIHQGEIERHLPLVDVFVKDIDIAAKKVVVEPPEELPEWER